MASNQGKEKGFFKGLLSGNSSRPTLLRGDPYESGVTSSARRARQDQAARHSHATHPRPSCAFYATQPQSGSARLCSSYFFIK